MSAGAAIGGTLRRRREEEARDEAAMENALARAFWRGLSERPMPPMAALEIAARVVGTLYRQIAAAHEGPHACGCGWHPEPDTDLIMLEAHLAAALLGPPKPDLARMPAAGRA